jgi:hypothetical protein
MVGQQPTLVVVPKMSGRKILLIVGSESLPHRGAKNRDKVEICATATTVWNSYLLELLDGTLVNTAALVDQVTCYVCERDVRGIDYGSRQAYRWWWTCQNRRGR